MLTELQRVGNSLFNSSFEAKMPPARRIYSNTDDKTREAFIRDKYERKAFFGTPNAASVATPNDLASMSREQRRALRQQQKASESSPPISSPSPAVSIAAASSSSTPIATSPSLFDFPTQAPSMSTTLPASDLDLFAGLVTSPTVTTSPIVVAAPTISSPAPFSSQSTVQSTSQPLQPVRPVSASPWVSLDDLASFTTTQANQPSQIRTDSTFSQQSSVSASPTPASHAYLAILSTQQQPKQSVESLDQDLFSGLSIQSNPAPHAVPSTSAIVTAPATAPATTASHNSAFDFVASAPAPAHDPFDGLSFEPPSVSSTLPKAIPSMQTDFDFALPRSDVMSQPTITITPIPVNPPSDDLFASMNVNDTHSASAAKTAPISNFNFLPVMDPLDSGMSSPITPLTAMSPLDSPIASPAPMDDIFSAPSAVPSALGLSAASVTTDDLSLITPTNRAQSPVSHSADPITSSPTSLSPTHSQMEQHTSNFNQAHLNPQQQQFAPASIAEDDDLFNPAVKTSTVIVEDASPFDFM